jgi:hypothetical protein
LIATIEIQQTNLATNEFEEIFFDFALSQPQYATSEFTNLLVVEMHPVFNTLIDPVCSLESISYGTSDNYVIELAMQPILGVFSQEILLVGLLLNDNQAYEPAEGLLSELHLADYNTAGSLMDSTVAALTCNDIPEEYFMQDIVVCQITCNDNKVSVNEIDELI